MNSISNGKISPAIAAALETLRAASDAVNHFEGPGDAPPELRDAETFAADALARCPVRNTEDFLSKLRALFEFEGACDPDKKSQRGCENFPRIAVGALLAAQVSAQREPQPEPAAYDLAIKLRARAAGFAAMLDLFLEVYAPGEASEGVARLAADLAEFAADLVGIMRRDAAFRSIKRGEMPADAAEEWTPEGAA